MFHSFHNCCQSFLFSHRNKLGLKRHMKKNAKMQDICNKETRTTAASLVFDRHCSAHILVLDDNIDQSYSLFNHYSSTHSSNLWFKCVASCSE